jgi:hypothetical protein
MNHRKQDRRRHDASGRNDLGERVVAGYRLDDGVLQRKDKNAKTEIGDPECGAILQGRLP